MRSTIGVMPPRIQSCWARTRPLLAAVVVMTGCAAGSPPSWPRSPAATLPATAATEVSPAAALQQAISMLVREGRQAKSREKLARATPDFAASFPHKPDPAALGLKIIRRVSDDPFIDAYARWQLTGFKPILPEMTDGQFAKMIDDLPAVLDNPRADSVLIAELTSAARGNPHDQATQQVIDKRLKSLEQRSARAEEFNRAPLEFRGWLRDELSAGSDDGQKLARQMLLAMEECRALIAAGWNAGAAKQRLEKLLETARTDRSLSTEQRQTIAGKVSELSGLKNLYISRANLEDGSLILDFGDTTIDDFEVRRWVRKIMMNE